MKSIEKTPLDDAIVSGLKAGGTERRMHERKLYEEFFYFIKQGERKYSIPEDECASAYSDTIIIVIENIITDKFEGRSSLKSYTFQIFMNKCVDFMRKKTTNKNKVHNTAGIDPLIMTLPDKTRNIIQQLIEKSERSSLLQKLKELGEKCKQVLLLFEDGYTDREIAETMQYNSADVVKTTRLRCLERLKEKVITGRL
jgi:RNA polymerase sigma factor (sigma-70 family)